MPCCCLPCCGCFSGLARRHGGPGRPVKEDPNGTGTLSASLEKAGCQVDLNVVDNTIRATELKKLKTAAGTPLQTFDPGYTNTVSCTSKISQVDGDKGMLYYRGYPIEKLCHKASFLEVAFLIIFGELPSKAQFLEWETNVMRNTYVHTDVLEFQKKFRYDAHPMGMLAASYAFMGTLYPEQNPAVAGLNIYNSKAVRTRQIYRIMGKAPTIAAIAYRHRQGRPFVEPNSEMSFSENFLYMLDALHEGPHRYKSHPELVRFIDILFILHAEHEVNCSASTMRHLASSGVNVYTATSAACGALYGTRHGGANQAAVEMLQEIASVEKVPEFLEKVKRKERLLMGFGHRIYKSYDPRARLARALAPEVFAVCGAEPLFDVATALEKAVLEDDYFKQRSIFPTLDFYSGLIFKAMGFPTDMFTVLFAVPRVVGWLAHWNEWMGDKEYRIYRPFQVYKGPELRRYEDIGVRRAQAPLQKHRTLQVKRSPSQVYYPPYSEEARLDAYQDDLRFGPKMTTNIPKPRSSVSDRDLAPDDVLKIVDSRTNKEYSLHVTDNTVRAIDLRQITSQSGVPLRSLDPGYVNTTCCVSRISFIDGGKGILRYRGYPIEELAEKSSFLEVAFLLIYGNLPSKDWMGNFERLVMNHSILHQDMVRLLSTFRYDAHPMGMLVSSFGAMGTLHPEQNPALNPEYYAIYQDPDVRNKQIIRLLGCAPTLAAMAYRHRLGKSFVEPNPSYSYAQNFLYMLDIMHTMPDGTKKPHPTIVKALDILFILHAEHELNCSTSAMRHLTSSGVDVYTSIAAAAGALYGPLHGGANEAVLRMLERIGIPQNVPAFVTKVKQKAEGAKLMGFGHRVYKSYDPRARIVKQLADDVLALFDPDPLLEVAKALEKTALEDEYFKSRNLYPNVDFYTGLIYKAVGIPTDMFTVFFTVPRLAGWLAHWVEWIDDTDNRIYRPLQQYQGSQVRDIVPMAHRKPLTEKTEFSYAASSVNRRRDVAMAYAEKHRHVA